MLVICLLFSFANIDDDILTNSTPAYTNKYPHLYGVSIGKDKFVVLLGEQLKNHSIDPKFGLRLSAS